MKPLYLAFLSAALTMGHFGVWMTTDKPSSSLGSSSSYRSFGSGSSYSGTSGGHK